MAESTRRFKGSNATTRRKANHSSRRLETLKVTSERAKEGRAKAHQVFLSLIEPFVTPQDFIEQVKWINPEIYDDVITERALSELCGYPLCPNTFTDTFGSRTYIIRSNTVYDITERRNYCSEVCYEASELVRGQLSVEPLYLRFDEGAVLCSVTLPQLDTLTGRHGRLIDITGGLLEMEDVNPKHKSPFKTLNEIAEESLINWSENEADKAASEQQTMTEKLDVIVEEEAMRSKEEEGGDKEVVDSSDEYRSSGCVAGKTLYKCSASGEIMKDDTNSNGDRKVSKEESVNDLVQDLNKLKLTSGDSEVNAHLQKKKSEKEACRALQEPHPMLPVFEVERAMREWMSFESLRYILGDKYVRGMLEHIGATWNDYDTTAGLRLGMEAKRKYIALCRKLDHEEKLGEAEMRETEGEESNLSSNPKQPLPDYQRLQDDAKRQERKVVAFFGGQDQYQDLISEHEGKEGSHMETIPEEKGGTSVSPTKQSKAKQRVTKENKNAGKTVDVEEENEDCTLPFECQIAWRQHIVMEKLISYVGKVVEGTQLELREVRRLIINLVSTLDLSSHNISFITCQWRLVAFIILHLLKIRYPIIGVALDSEGIRFMQDSVLSVFGLDAGYWVRIVAFLTEIQHIINKNFTEKEEVQMN